MHKFLKFLRSLVLLPVSLPTLIALIATFALAVRTARTDRRRAAWLLLRLATFTNRTTPTDLDKPERKRKNRALFVLPALLLQGAPWPRVHRWCDALSNCVIAFEFYFAERRFDDAAQAARAWCEQTELAINGRESEMRAFFAEHGADLSRSARNELWMQDYQAKREADSQAKAPKFFDFLKRTPPDFVPFLRRYDARLALAGTRWVAMRHPNSRQLKREFARQCEDRNFFVLPQFRVDEASLRALGMSETKLAAAQREAME